MAKKYYSERRAFVERREDHEGVERRGRTDVFPSYGRKSPYSSSHMLSEDRNAPCLLPTGVVDKYYSKYAHAMPDYHLPDLSTGVEKQLAEDHADMRKVFGPAKY